MTDHGPLVCTLLAPTLEAFARALEGGAAARADVVELRLDRVADEVVRDPAALAALVARAERPTIAALHGGEGFGTFAGDVPARAEVLRAAARAGVTYIDVDERFAAEVGDLGARRILSTHRSASGIEEVDALARGLDALAEPGRDLVKVVPPAATAEEGLALLRWLADRPAEGTIAFCSGDVASFTRLLAPAFGSALVYAAADDVPGVDLESAAPGQLRVGHVRDVWGPRTPSRATTLAAVCGRPIAHSASPVVHGAALRQAGIDGMLVPVAPAALAAVVAAAADAPAEGPRWGGLSATAPFKLDALACADRVLSDAQAVGAANTLAVAGGAWTASNTDAPAVRAALEAAG
ncbi:MAG: type I 3-dehydroquinate dehydratase, partial [Planctomycetota bacterium]